MKRGGLLAAALVLCAAAPVQSAALCVGDCDGNGAVAINELIAGVNLALGAAPQNPCLSFDADQSGTVAINELVTAVSNALKGCPPDTSGVRLEGPTDMPALVAVHDLDVERGAPSSEIGTEGGGRMLIRTRIEIGLRPGATVGQVNALLDSIGGRIVLMLDNVPILFVRVADPGTVESLTALVGRVEGDPIVRFVHKAYLAIPDVLPENFSPEPFDPDFSKIDHHLAVRAAAAWNARKAIRTAEQPTVVIQDFFGGGPPVTAPGGGFAVRVDEAEDFTTVAEADRDDHGYHVAGIIAASFGGSAHCSDTAALGESAGRECATGMFPGTTPLRAVDQASHIGHNAADDKTILILKRLVAQGVNGVFNTSLANHCERGDDSCVPVDEARQDAVVWIEKIRLSGLEDRFLHLTSAGNVRAGFPAANDASENSRYTAAALRADLQSDGVPVANLNNILVVENGIQTPQPPYEIGCLNNISYIGGHLSAIGTDVWSLVDAGTRADDKTGTSMATPQVAGLAAYVWALAPELSPLQVAGVLQATARQDFSYSLSGSDARCYGATVEPAPTIDAYDAVLSLDAAAIPDPTNAPVRLAILDADDDRDFDQDDIAVFIDHYIDPQTGEPRVAGEQDYSRYDLNGDDFTGGSFHGPFDLDREGSTQFGRSVYSTVLQNIGGDVGFDETDLTDLQILCYYAYSPLYTGGDERREELLAGRCAEVAVTVTPGSALLGPGGTQQFSATVRGTADPRVTWSMPAGGGTITDTGLFTAGTTDGTFPVRATSKADPDVFGETSVTIESSTGGEVTFHQHEDFVGLGSVDTMITATVTSANAVSCEAAGMGRTIEEFPGDCGRPPEMEGGEIVGCNISVFVSQEGPIGFLSFDFSGTRTSTACGSEPVVRPYNGSLFAHLEGRPIFTNGIVTAIDFNRTTTNGNEITVTTGVLELGPCTTEGCLD